MRKLLLAAGAVLALGAVDAARAATVSDPIGDFGAFYTNSKDADLDVTSFTVTYDAGAKVFSLGATFAGAINTAQLGSFYVIGVNRGGAGPSPFGPAAPAGFDINEGGVIFNRALVIRKNGTGLVSGNPFAVTIAGNSFSALVPLALLPSTGFAPQHYGFNLWSRFAGNNFQIADFSPENSTISAAPEPSSWALMIAGFGLAGTALRRHRAVGAHI